MAQANKLPIGIQTFNKIRDSKSNFIYVDKTELALSLIRKPGYYFISRPRRFGKSLFLDTLSEIFKGSKALFEGLSIYDKWDWNQQCPVLKIDFTSGNYKSGATITTRLVAILQRNAINHNITYSEIESDDLGTTFENLIIAIAEDTQQKVVILVDEYDKPILDNITNTEVAKEAREILRTFYSAIKSNDTYLQFVFITGVSKFSKLNLFSGLNNLEDITIDKRYATITGYTHSDIENYFSDYTKGLDLEEVKRWYNGYNYLGTPVYNPFDILLFFSKGNQFRNYWWQTGNPQFLIEKLKETPQKLPELQNLLVSEDTLNSFDIEHIELSALLWQTGYLTFAGEKQRPSGVMYYLKVPNLEIQSSLNALFFDYLVGYHNQKDAWRDKLCDVILDADILAFEQQLKALFTAIPYNNYVKNTIANFEGYYASVLYAFLCSIGFEVKAEDVTNKGRIDMTIIGPNQIFILEFKVDMPAEAALFQIKEKRYYEKYTTQGKPIYLIGIQFSSEERNIIAFEWEQL